MDKKAWYKSKGIWVALATILVAGWNWSIDLGANLPTISEHLYIILGALGIYSRKVAQTKIGK